MPGKKVEMGRTGTIRCTEALQGCGGSTELLQRLGPLVFSTERIIGIPDLSQGCDDAQVVDMPMRRHRTLAGVRHTCQHPTWTERTSHIHIEARLDIKLPEPSDLYRLVSAG